MIVLIAVYCSRVITHWCMLVVLIVVSFPVFYMSVYKYCVHCNMNHWCMLVVLIVVSFPVFYI